MSLMHEVIGNFKHIFIVSYSHGLRHLHIMWVPYEDKSNGRSYSPVVEELIIE